MLDQEFFYKLLYFTKDFSQIENQLKECCAYCKVIKLERSHHCRRCKRCYLKMDHHCVILNSCVGYGNYKLYLVFLFYTTLMLLFAIITLFEGLRFYYVIFGLASFAFKFYVFGFVFVCVTFCAIGELFLFHIGLVAKGITTIENSESILVNLRDNDKGNCLVNLKEVLGEKVWTWFLPTSLNQEDFFMGYIFTKNYKQFVDGERKKLKTHINSSFYSEPDTEN